MTALAIIIGVIGVGIIAAFMFVMYACCVAGGRADDLMEEAIRRMRGG